MIELPPSLDTMAARKQWVLWSWKIDEDTKPRKKPYGLNGAWGIGNASTGTFSEVVELWKRLPGAFGGVGYVPSIHDSVACMDFDALPHSLWPDLLRHTYCERSPSNVEHKGHALVTLRPFAKKRLSGIAKLGGIELFSDSRFFTVTGLALNELPLFDASDHLCGLADRLNAQPKVITPYAHVAVTGRVVSYIEKGKIYEKMRRWSNGPKIMMMVEDWSGVCSAAWAPRGGSGPNGIDRSQCMLDFICYLLHAGARDPDLLMALIRESAVWKDGYGRRADAEAMLINSIIPLALSKYPPPPPPTGPAVPSHLKEAEATFILPVRT